MEQLILKLFKVLRNKRKYKIMMIPLTHKIQVPLLYIERRVFNMILGLEVMIIEHLEILQLRHLSIKSLEKKVIVHSQEKQ